MEEHMVSERMRQKLDQVNRAAQHALAPVQDHVNFTLQQAYFKCAYECFHRSQQQDEISRCVEHCSVPVVAAQQRVESELSLFQDKLSRALMVCQDNYDTAKSQLHPNSLSHLEACVDRSIHDSITTTLPHLATKLAASFSLSN